MPQPQTLNPYVPLLTGMGQALDVLYTLLRPDPQVKNLVDAIVNLVIAAYYPNCPTQIRVELTSVAYTAINSYENSLVLQGGAFYNSKQWPFIEMLIGHEMQCFAPDAIVDRLVDINDNIGMSDLTIEEQSPLFLAAASGAGVDVYWKNQVANSGPWSSFFPLNSLNLYETIKYLDIAAMNGALIGYGATIKGMIEPTVDITFLRLLSGFIGASTLTTGKLIFGWTPLL